MPPKADAAQARLGRVLLVGAGPGAADLLTLRAARAIGAAQALLYDALVSDEVLALAPACCLKIQTGKRAGRTSMRQETINRLMLRLARRGLDVVRLKGGDPSVFGRVGEEQAFLAAHGVATEVVPGVTAACAAAAQFGFPLTHRGEARRLLFTTARLEAGALQTDWAAAADPQTTLAIYMGGSVAAELAERLIALGRAPSTPAAVVQSAGAPDAVMRQGELADLAELTAELGEGPVLLVVGEVAALALNAQAQLVAAAAPGAPRRAPTPRAANG
jgi:uroporphyrin-III C-methyltransferase